MSDVMDVAGFHHLLSVGTIYEGLSPSLHNTVKPVCNDHLYNKIDYL